MPGIERSPSLGCYGVFIRVYEYVFIYACMHAWMDVCMYVYAYTYVYMVHGAVVPWNNHNPGQRFVGARQAKVGAWEAQALTRKPRLWDRSLAGLQFRERQATVVLGMSSGIQWCGLGV